MARQPELQSWQREGSLCFNITTRIVLWPIQLTVKLTLGAFCRVGSYWDLVLTFHLLMPKLRTHVTSLQLQRNVTVAWNLGALNPFY